MNFLDQLLGSPEGQQELASQQLQTQLQAVALQNEAEIKAAELKYSPERLAEQRKTIITVSIVLVISGVLLFFAIRYLK